MDRTSGAELVRLRVLKESQVAEWRAARRAFWNAVDREQRARKTTEPRKRREQLDRLQEERREIEASCRRTYAAWKATGERIGNLEARMAMGR